MSNEYSGIHDNAVGRAIQAQNEQIEEAKAKRERLTELNKQLNAVADDARVVANPKTEGIIDITVKCNTLTEELEILMGMESVRGEITHDDEKKRFEANLKYDYRE